MRYDMVIAAVGGQGAVTTAHVIAEAAILAGTNARVGETYGAAMRGGSVLSHVRIGEVYSPLVRQGCAQSIVGLEPLEGFRAAVRFMRQGTLILLDSHTWHPIDVDLFGWEYPSLKTIENQLRGAGGRVCIIDSTQAAEKAGSVRSMNIVMVGALFGMQGIPLAETYLIEAIRRTVPHKTVDINIKAFEIGREQTCQT